MDQPIDELLNLDERNNAILAGMILGFFAGLFVASIARSNVSAQARQKVTDMVGEMDLAAIQSRMPDRLAGGNETIREAFAAGRSRATDIVNQSPIPVTLGSDGEASPVDAESEDAELEDELAQTTSNREPTESPSAISDE